MDSFTQDKEFGSILITDSTPMTTNLHEVFFSKDLRLLNKFNILPENNCATEVSVSSHKWQKLSYV
jgi:hypothetical protein